MPNDDDSEATFGGSGAKAADRAFDQWLKRWLAAVYGDVLAEPIPEVLLKLIEQDRSREA